MAPEKDLRRVSSDRVLLAQLDLEVVETGHVGDLRRVLKVML